MTFSAFKKAVSALQLPQSLLQYALHVAEVAENDTERQTVFTLLTKQEEAFVRAQKKQEQWQKQALATLEQLSAST